MENLKFSRLFKADEWLSGPDDTGPVPRPADPSIAAFQERINGFDEWLREGGNTDVADLIQDLFVELVRARAR